MNVIIQIFPIISVEIPRTRKTQGKAKDSAKSSTQTKPNLSQISSKTIIANIFSKVKK